MNFDVAMNVHKDHYENKMSFEQYKEFIERGIMLLRKSAEIGKNNFNSLYKSEDQKAVNIALEYNEALMLQKLRR